MSTSLNGLTQSITKQSHSEMSNVDHATDRQLCCCQYDGISCKVPQTKHVKIKHHRYHDNNGCEMFSIYETDNTLRVATHAHLCTEI